MIGNLFRQKLLFVLVKKKLTLQNLIAGAKPSCQQLSNSLSSPTKKKDFCQLNLKNEVVNNNDFLDA